MTTNAKENRPVIAAGNLFKSFYHPHPLPILKGIDFDLFAGDTVAIMGRSGEGKSTLLQILGTLETPCSGTVEVAGIVATKMSSSVIRRKFLGFVFQSFHLLEDYTVLENVLMPAKIARKSCRKGSPSYEYGMYLLERVGLHDRATAYGKRLSGGEKQRIAIARALCNNPAAILADEPSGNLDRATADTIHTLLMECAAEQRKALVIVTHDDALSRLCHRRYELHDGLLRQHENA